VRKAAARGGMSKTTDGETKTILKKLSILILVSVPRTLATCVCVWA
jgi:hypothetical protein